MPSDILNIEPYERSLIENCDFIISSENGNEAEYLSIKEDLEEIIYRHKRQFELHDKNMLDINPASAASLKNSIIADKEWQQILDRIINIEDKNINIEYDNIGQIFHIPWHNELIMMEKEQHYDGQNLYFSGKLGHSYTTYLNRFLTNEGAKRAGINSIVITEDNIILLGLRGGNSYSNVIFTMASGGLAYLGNKNPFIETIKKEHQEECHITPEKIDTIELIGRISDDAYSSPHYIARTKLKITYEHFIEEWEKASDKNEHKRIIALPNDPEAIIEFDKEHKFDASKINIHNPALTSIENYGKILPIASASVLCHHAQNEGLDYIRKIGQELGPTYIFINHN